MNNCMNNSTSRVLCLALLFYAFVVASPCKAIAGPLDKGVLNMEDEAVRDMQWRQKVERPRTPTQQQAIPAPMQGPVVPQPDLSGLPRQLPQGGAGTPADPARDRVLSKPTLNESRHETQTLIKPRIRGVAGQEPTPVARQKVPVPVPGAVQVQPRSPEFATTPVKPVDVHRHGKLPKLKLDNSRHDKQALIKPRIGKVPAQERTPAVRQRVSEPARQAVQIQPPSSIPQPDFSPIKGIPSPLARRAPVPAQREAAAPIIQPLGPPAQPREAPRATTGLIKPHLGGLAPEQAPLVRRP